MVERKKTKPSQGSTKAAAKGATAKELTTHRITNKKPNLKKQPLVIRSVALTEANEQTLAHLKQTATDYIGRATSSSAIIRACLRFLAQQPAGWIIKQIHPLIEAEIEQGRLWGKSGKP